MTEPTLRWSRVCREPGEWRHRGCPGGVCPCPCHHTTAEALHEDGLRGLIQQATDDPEGGDQQ